MIPPSEQAEPAIDLALMARVEDAGINASAPREQLLVDGWLVRLSPGKAKRARCVQAVAAGRLSIDDKLWRCRSLYEVAGLQLFIRITPFSEPAGLDAHLAALGMDRVDDSRVMIAPTLPSLDSEAPSDADLGLPADTRLEHVASAAFAEWIGRARGSSAQECDAHAARIAQAAVPHQAFVVVDGADQQIAGAQLVVEAGLAGLYDVFTVPSHRRRGIGHVLCRRLLQDAARAGATTGYLQVDAANKGARRVYHSLGFVDAYSYHYRTPRRAAST